MVVIKGGTVQLTILHSNTREKSQISCRLLQIRGEMCNERSLEGLQNPGLQLTVHGPRVRLLVLAELVFLLVVQSHDLLW